MIHHPVVLRRLRVLATVEVSATLRRVVLGGDQLGGFVSNGFECPPFATAAFDDHVKVVLAGPAGDVVLPLQHDGHLHWPDAPAATARDYTVRRFDAAAGALTLDVVTDHDGPGSSWGSSVRVGDVVHVAGPRASAVHDLDADHLVLVADETAMPAVGRLLETISPLPPVTLVAVVGPDTDVSTALGVATEMPDGIAVRRVERHHGADEPADAVAAVVDDVVRNNGVEPARLWVWAGCEFGVARAVRRVCAANGVDKSRTAISHYWRAGPPLDESAAAARLLRQSDLVTPWALRVAATLGIADAIEEGAASAEAIAAAVGAHPVGVFALVEYLVEVEVLRRGADGYLLGATGELLRSNHPLGARARLTRSAAEFHLDASFAGLPIAVREGRAAHADVFGTDFWTLLARDEEIGASFDTYLAGWVQAWAPAVVDQAIWSGCRRIVDVGGGDGSLLAHLLARHPHLHGTLVEQPSTAARATDLLTTQGLAGRFDVSAQSFFDPLPSGADAYVLAQVLHDWPDDRATDILRGCAQAAGPDGHVVLIERLPNVDGTTRQFLSMNLLMLSLFGATERSLAHYTELAERAGLRFVDVQTTPTGLCLIDTVVASVPVG